VGPEHSHLSDIGRAEYRPVTDTQAMDAFAKLCRTEGIIPAIESAHAIAGATQLAAEGVDLILVNVSGRGDKDVDTAARWFGLLGGGQPPEAGVYVRKGDDDGDGAYADGGVEG
jgi:tryptophan synthase beta chain